MKPASLLTLMKGRALGAFEGFVSFFNWMGRFLYYLRSQTGTIAITDPSNNNHYSLDIAGYDTADPDTVPTKTSSGLKWKKGGSVDCDELTTTTSQRSEGKLSIFGAYDADPGTVPHLTSTGSLQWKVPTSFIVRAGASGADHTCTKALVLTSGSNSNVSFTVTDDSAGTVTIAVDVYYK